MRMGSTLLALALSAAIPLVGQAQSSTDPLAIPPAGAKTGVKPAPAKKPAANSKRPKRPTMTRSARLMQAQMAAEARFNAVAPPQMPQPFGGDPLGLAAGSPGVAVYGNPPITGTLPYGGGFAVAGTGGGRFSVPGLFTVPGVGTAAAIGSQAASTATGGLVGPSDTRLIHGFDGDGTDVLPPTNSSVTGVRSDRVRGGIYTPGVGVPLRKGEPVNRGNYIPGRGVIGASTDQVAGGTYTPGYGVGSFDPRVQNGRTDQVAGGQLIPGFGVVAGGAASSFRAGIPGYYGGSSLPGNNYNVGNPGYYGTTGTATTFGGTAIPGYYGGAGVPSAYGATGLLPGFGAAGNAGSYGVSGVPSYYGTTGTATTFGGTGHLGGFGSTIPSAYGAGSLPAGTHR